MGKQITEFLSGFVNVCEGTFTIGREKNLNGMEYVIISLDGKELYTFWNNPKKKVTNKPPKHTGGKQPYAKVMGLEIPKYKISNNAKAFLWSMIPHVNWGTNLLIETKSKKPLLISDICKVMDNSNKTVVAIINELKTTGLLIKDKDGYKVSPNLIQKGGAAK